MNPDIRAVRPDWITAAHLIQYLGIDLGHKFKKYIGGSTLPAVELRMRQGQFILLPKTKLTPSEAWVVEGAVERFLIIELWPLAIEKMAKEMETEEAMAKAVIAANRLAKMFKPSGPRNGGNHV